MQTQLTAGADFSAYINEVHRTSKAWNDLIATEQSAVLATTNLVSAIDKEQIAQTRAIALAKEKIMANTNLTATEKAYAGILHEIPLGRAGQPEDVAKVVAFLATSDSEYMTGQAINVSGGYLMCH